MYYLIMEIDLPVPIDDSLPLPPPPKPHQTQWLEPPDNEQELPPEPQYYQPEPRYYIQQQPPPPPPPQIQKKFDIFSDLDRTHWIIIIACILLAFFMGKSIATPIIIRAVT